MAGLLEKDFRIIFTRKQALLMMTLICLFMAGSTDGSFIVGFMSILGVTLSIGTISYDDLDNGMSFLMTLPISRKTYVKEKYVFISAVALVFWVIASIVYVAFEVYKGEGLEPMNMALAALTFIPFIFLVLDIMVPIELKFGAQKSRIALFILAGAMAAIVMFGLRMIDGMKEEMWNSFKWITSIQLPILVGIIAAITIVITIISYLISQRIMANKEF